jgi:uncharacterized RDD family membrane protein YckC
MVGEEEKSAPANENTLSSAVETVSAGDKPEYAGFWLRFAAVIIDNFLYSMCWSFIVPFVAIVVIIIVSSGGEISEATEDKVSIIGNCVFYVVWLIVSAFLESSKLQATIGKLALGIKVQTEAGEKLTFAQAFLRNFTKILSVLPLFMGFIMATWTKKKQALHDKIMHTTVVVGRNI